MRKTLLAVAGLAALALGCDQGPERSITGPESGTRAVPALQQSVIRANGQAMRLPRTRSTQKTLRPNAAMGALTVTAAVTAVCDQGALVEDTDENGNPNGHFFPEGGLADGTYDNVQVPPNKICVLGSGVTVTNSVTALAHSLLFVQGAHIGANVVGQGADVVQANSESEIGGNFNVLGGGSLAYDFASCSVDNVTIGGNLSCVGQNPASPVINPNTADNSDPSEPIPDEPVTVAGSVLITANRIPGGFVLNLLNVTVGNNADVFLNIGQGAKVVTGNVVTHRLLCRFNTPLFIGGPNTAATKIGQCF